jgi:hypothetical protein
VRTEEPVKLGVQMVVDAYYAESIGLAVMQDLRDQLMRMAERTGRLPVGDVEVERHQDLMWNQWTYRAQVRTRESDQGSWPEVWAAYREDQAWFADPVDR